MGLGKTVQAIAAAATLHEAAGVRRVLVVAPTSLKTEWEEQIRKFTGLKYEVLLGSRQQRLEVYKNTSAFFLIANYEQVVRDHDLISAHFAPGLMILDEAQRIKNWQTKTARTLKRIESRFVFVLTGTPLENRIDEVYSLMSILDPQVLGPLFRFNREFYVLNANGRPEGYKNLQNLRERIRPYLLRRRKADNPLRETIEETGLAVGWDGLRDREIAAVRRALLGGTLLSDILASRDERIALDALVPFARWCPNFKEARTFDTRFYAVPAPAHGHGARVVAPQLGDEGGKVDGLGVVVHRRQVDQHWIVVEKPGVVAQPLGQVARQLRRIGGLEHHSHHGQMGAFEFKAGAGVVARRVNGHGMVRKRRCSKARSVPCSPLWARPGAEGGGKSSWFHTGHKNVGGQFISLHDAPVTMKNSAAASGMPAAGDRVNHVQPFAIKRQQLH